MINDPKIPEKGILRGGMMNPRQIQYQSKQALQVVYPVVVRMPDGRVRSLGRGTLLKLRRLAYLKKLQKKAEVRGNILAVIASFMIVFFGGIFTYNLASSWFSGGDHKKIQVFDVGSAAEKVVDYAADVFSDVRGSFFASRNDSDFESLKKKKAKNLQKKKRLKPGGHKIEDSQA